MARRPATGDRPFVGRQRELASIADACDAAHQGRGSLLVVRGPAGIGKTTLCERAAERAEYRGVAVCWGRCWPDGGAPPLWPWSAVLIDLGGPEAAALLADGAPRPDLEADRFTRFSAVAEVVAERARTRPTTIVLDDAHVADPAALLLARFLATALNREAFALVMTRRTGERTPPESGRLLDALERDAVVVAIPAFEEQETAALVAAHGLHVEDYGLVPALTRLTEGNPFLLTRAVARASASSSAAAGAEQVIGDSLDGLSPPHRHLVAVGAVLRTGVTTDAIAAVAGLGRTTVLDALDDASSAGLLAPTPGGWVFTHDLVRTAALTRLGPVEAIDAHARALEIMTADDRPETVTLRAHHALVAAARSDADARVALQECRQAAGVLGRGFDHERASALLESAATLSARLSPPAEHVDVLLDWADALLVCGRLADARQVYATAADAGETAGDARARARAALGLGGVWVNEHREQADRERVLGMQRAALAGLPADELRLRARLRTRLAAEAVYDGGPVEPVLEAIEAARGVGDDRVLAESLSLGHHALLAPEHAGTRLSLAEELITVATSAGDDLRVLFGLLWKAVDLFLAGEGGARRCLDGVRHRADAVGCRSISYVVAAIDVMHLIRAGRLGDAESAAQECFELGIEVGDADATGYYGAQLLTIRWLQDRDAELIDLSRDIASGSTLVAPEFAYRAGTAVIAARAGHVDEAAARLRALRREPLAALPRSSTWLSGMCNLAEAAWTLDDAELAAELRPLLEPFGDRPVMPSLAVTCFGAASRALGLVAIVTGEPDLAVHHLKRAVRRNVELGNRPMTAMARADLGAALVARGQPGDGARAIDLLTTAAGAAAAMGMDRRAETWRRCAAELSDSTAHAAVLRRNGEGWVVEVDRRRVAVPDLIGVGYLCDLLAHPGEEISAVDLCGGANIQAGRQEVVDRSTLESYRRRVADLDEMIETAERRGRTERARQLEDERGALRDELARVLSRSGRTRRFADPDERARTAVRKAIVRALDAIAACDHDLGAELRATISTGQRCSYVPDPARPRQWVVQSQPECLNLR